MSSYGARGLLAAGLCTCVFAACSDPEIRTNLRPEGDPEVLTVMAYTTEVSAGGTTLEKAMFCKSGDDKVPTLIGLPDAASTTIVCPEDGSAPPDVVDTDALLPLVRIVFDELLDTSVEELLDSETGEPCTIDSATCFGTIANTLPVTVECGGTAIAYDGYYAPNGNNVSWPPGPSLVVIPQEPVPGGGTCQVTINDVARDKSGNAVPTAQRGPFEFGIVPFAIAGTDPAPNDPPPEVATDTAVTIIFNNYVDAASVDATDIVLNDGTTDVAVDVTGADNTLLVTATGGLVEGTSYTLTIPTGATFDDLGGGSLTTTEDVVLEFTAVAPAM